MTEQYPEFSHENRIDLHMASEDLLPFKVVEARNDVGAVYASSAPESYKIPNAEAPSKPEVVTERDFVIGIGEAIRNVRQHPEG